MAENVPLNPDLGYERRVHESGAHIYEIVGSAPPPGERYGAGAQPGKYFTEQGFVVEIAVAQEAGFDVVAAKTYEAKLAKRTELEAALAEQMVTEEANIEAQVAAMTAPTEPPPTEPPA